MRNAPGSRRRGRSPHRWLSLMVAVVLIGVTVPTAACGDDDDAGPVLSDDPPWGLTGIEMPDTEAEVIAALQAMPAVDSHQPTFDLEEEFGHPAVIYDEIEDYGLRVVIEAIPNEDGDPLGSFAPDMYEAEGWTVEEADLDPNGDLLWMALTNDVVSGCLWADPDGSWMFAVQADSADTRIKLVHAFATAAD